MGLDMYLSKRIFVGAEYEHRKVTGDINIKSNGKEIKVNFNKVSEIIEKVGYWRKANAIHKWFVDNVQGGEDDCKEYYVSLEDLQKLLDDCKTVFKNSRLINGKVRNGTIYEDGKEMEIYEDGMVIEDSSVAQELLPTKDGFFFGRTNYDQWYIEDIKTTIEIIEEALKDENGDFYYSSSW